MDSMKRILLFLSLILICITMVPVIHADIIDPYHKEVQVYYQIINIKDYPDYVFLLNGNPSPSFMVLNSSEFNFYKLSIASIYAVEKSKYNQTQLENFNSTGLNNYFENSTDVIHSNLELQGSLEGLNSSNSLEKVVIELEITSLNQTQLVIKKTHMKFIYSDGSTKTVDYPDQNTTPSPDTSSNSDVWYFILPSAALIAIFIILVHRRVR